MPVLKRIKTNYPGVYYVMGRSLAQVGKSERIYYIRYRKTEIEDKVLLNVRELVTPYLDKLKTGRLDAKEKSFLDILESNLKDIISPFLRRLSSEHLKLTPTEIQISNLIRQGKTTKEIADLFNLSGKTIDAHRRNIRNKLGIRNKKENLRTHLLTLLND